MTSHVRLLTAFLWNLVTGLPAVPLHEAAHAVVARAAGADVEAGVDGRRPFVQMRWSAGTSRLAVWSAHLAPTVIGFGLLLVLVALFGIPSARDLGSFAVHELALLVMLAVNWVVFSYPSREDRRPFSGTRRRR